jgi:GT2 family glycosyltransferase
MGRGLASVIVPCWNQREFTRHCLFALFRHSTPPWELIVIDNGSTDGTAAYLEGVRDVASVPVTIVTNTENRGFPAACNQGLVVASGSYVILLNNDTVPTAGWLDQLIALADSDPKIGMVGPMSNYVPSPQLVKDVPYSDLNSMHRFAEAWRAEQHGRWIEALKLSGFCLFAKREVLEAVGGFDERFGLGFFDDDDLSFRVRDAGYRLAVALDLFVHHFGSRTFAGSAIDAERLLEENAGRFAAKWGDRALTGHRVRLTAWS